MASSPAALSPATALDGGGERERLPRLGEAPSELFRCWGCLSFLGEPVTAPCGHTSCRRCLREKLHARCRHCGDPLAGTTVAVVLAHLAEKWFPAECARARTWRRLAELLRQGRPREAREAADQALRKGKGTGERPAANFLPSHPPPLRVRRSCGRERGLRSRVSGS